MSRALRAVVAAAAALSAHTSWAQRGATLDVGAVTVRYTDSTRLRATTLAPSLRFGEGAFSGAANGTLSLFDDSAWTGQGTVSLSVLSPFAGALRAELAADAGGSTHEDGTRTGRYLGRGRLHIGDRSAGAWAGLAAGQTWDGANWRNLAQGDAGVWMRRGTAVLFVTANPVRVGEELRYTDAEALVLFERGRTELVMRAGIRGGDSTALHSESRWGSVAATFWMLPNLALVGAGGTYPADFTQGFPGGRFAALSLRVAARGHRDSAPGRTTTRSGQSGPRMELRSMGAGHHLVRVHAPNARRVEIMGDLTSWTPVMLEPDADGWWQSSLTAGRGTYQVNVRVNGGRWIAPAGLPQSTDEFGVPVGVLAIR